MPRPILGGIAVGHLEVKVVNAFAVRILRAARLHIESTMRIVAEALDEA